MMFQGDLFRCVSGHTNGNPRVSLGAPLLQFTEEKHAKRQQSVQGVESLCGLSTICAAHRHRQFSSSI